MRVFLQIRLYAGGAGRAVLNPGAKGKNELTQKKEMLKFIEIFSLLIACIYGIPCLFLFLMQAKLLYYPDQPSRELSTDPVAIGLEYESVNLKTADNILLHGWFIRAEPARGTLLFFHGNAGNISHRLDSIRIFHDLGLAVLIIDYRGYGQSQGKASEEGTYLDGEAAWKYLIETRQIPPVQVIVFGRSLGAAVAAHIGAKYRPGALILESAFTSVPDLAARIYPIFPVRLLSRFAYNTKNMLQAVKCPVLIIHSPDDDIIPFENGLELYEVAAEPKEFLKIDGGHNDGFLVSSEKYSAGINNFIDTSFAFWQEKRQNEPAR
jgi:fermentation-respiration switch protein FrsA (DUF1100 family)